LGEERFLELFFSEQAIGITKLNCQNKNSVLTSLKIFHTKPPFSKNKNLLGVVKMERASPQGCEDFDLSSS